MRASLGRRRRLTWAVIVLAVSIVVPLLLMDDVRDVFSIETSLVG